jgi:Domain of unknown function (DUF4331)
MSSHREAPAISQDPVADNTDTYAFVSPDQPGTLTIISNYIPGEAPAGGPNFYEFGEDVLYTINIDNDGDADDDYSFQFRFETRLNNDDTFLYNTGPITSLSSPSWNRKQFYDVSLVRENGDSTVLGSDLSSPPCNIGPRSTPDYGALADAAVHSLSNGIRVFAGQRADPFFVDLGSIFDLGALRPLQDHHLIPLPATAGVNTLRNANVHTIAIQLPISLVTKGHTVPTNPLDPAAVLGIYASAKRRRVTVAEDSGEREGTGPWVQVSRLANPLFNEVIVPMADKDRWNALDPNEDDQFLKYVQHPELAKLLPILYPGAFPNLAALTAARADLVAILLTGIPSGIVPGFQNFTGSTLADLLRLNVAIPATSSPNPLGLIGGDPAGFPNGRRLQDDVVTIELQAIAGRTVPLVMSYTVDAVVPAVTDGLTIANSGVHYLSHFPYVGLPHDGFHTPLH